MILILYRSSKYDQSGKDTPCILIYTLTEIITIQLSELQRFPNSSILRSANYKEGGPRKLIQHHWGLNISVLTKGNSNRL